MHIVVVVAAWLWRCVARDGSDSDAQLRAPSRGRKTQARAGVVASAVGAADRATDTSETNGQRQRSLRIAGERFRMAIAQRAAPARMQMLSERKRAARMPRHKREPHCHAADDAPWRELNP